MLRPLRERNYRLWAAADIVSVCGTWMQVLALNWLVLKITGSAAAMGVSVLLQAVPGVLLAGWGGALADRLPCRAVLVGCQGVRIALSLALLAAAGAETAVLPVVYAVTVASGVVGALEGPALGRFGSSLVPPDGLGSALALGSVLSSGGRILGTALGGVAVAAFGSAPLFAANAVSYLGVIAALLAVRADRLYPLPTAGADDEAAGVRGAARYLLRQPVVLVVLGLSFLLGSLGRNYQITMAAMSDGPLGAGAAGYGLLSTVFAVGGVAGGLAAAASGRTSLALLLGAGGGISVLQAVAGVAPGLLGFAVLIGPIAAGAVIVDTVVAARVQLDTRPELRGRMVAALGLVSSLAGMVGAPLLGWLCDTVGARGALSAAGVLTTVGCVAAGVALLRLHPAGARWARRLSPLGLHRLAPAH